MDSGVIIGFISAIGTAVGSIIGICINSSLTRWRLEQLEKKVQVHNNAIERLIVAEGKIDEHSRKMKALEQKTQIHAEEIRDIMLGDNVQIQ